MKKIYCLFVLAALFVSCNKDFLETVPSDFLAPEIYYQTEEQLNFAKASVYNSLGSSDLWGTIANYLLGFSADEGYMNRSSLVIGPWNHNHVPSDSYNSRFWSNLYRGISRANQLLANVDNNPQISKEFRDQVRGEVLFLRGYYNFLLVQFYGPVPLKLMPTVSVEDVDSPNAEIDAIYDQIIIDMTEAEKLVKSISEVGCGGQVNKSAVRGLLARVNLYMAGKPLNDASRYAEAKKWAKMVMDDTESNHALNPSFAQVFINYAADAYDIKESIWEAEFWVTGSTAMWKPPTSDGLMVRRYPQPIPTQAVQMPICRLHQSFIMPLSRETCGNFGASHFSPTLLQGRTGPKPTSMKQPTME